MYLLPPFISAPHSVKAGRQAVGPGGSGAGAGGGAGAGDVGRHVGRDGDGDGGRDGGTSVQIQTHN